MEELLFELERIAAILSGTKSDWQDIYDETTLAGELLVKKVSENHGRPIGTPKEYAVTFDPRLVHATVAVRHSPSEKVSRIRFSHTDNIPEVEFPDVLFYGPHSQAIREAQRLLGDFVDAVAEALPERDSRPDDEVIEAYQEWEHRVNTMAPFFCILG